MIYERVHVISFWVLLEVTVSLYFLSSLYHSLSLSLSHAHTLTLSVFLLLTLSFSLSHHSLMLIGLGVLFYDTQSLTDSSVEIPFCLSKFISCPSLSL